MLQLYFVFMCVCVCVCVCFEEVGAVLYVYMFGAFGGLYMFY